MKKAMIAWLRPVDYNQKEWIWDKAETLFAHKDLKTREDVDWRTLVRQLADIFDWRLTNCNFRTVKGLADLIQLEPVILRPGLRVIDRYEGVVHGLPEGAIVMCDVENTPAVALWEEELDVYV